MKRIISVLFCTLAFSCSNKEVKFVGITPTTLAPAKSACMDAMNLTSDCKIVGNAPNETQGPFPVALVITGDDPTPPPSGYTVNGSVRVPLGTPNTWQKLGQNNQAPISVNIQTNLKHPGQCTQLDVKTTVSSPAPSTAQGTFYTTSRPDRFEVCLDGSDVLVKFEDGVDNLFNDYQFRIHANNGQNLNYTITGTTLNICLD